MPDLAERLRELVDSGAAEITVDEIIDTHDQLFAGRDATIVDGYPMDGPLTRPRPGEWDRRWRRRGSVLVAAALVVAAAVGTGIVLLPGGGPSKSVRVGSGGGAVASNPSAGISVTVPSGWRNLPRAKTADPQELLVVGNSQRPSGDPIQACFGVGGSSTNGVAGWGSVYVSVYGYAPGQSLTRLPSGARIETGTYDPSAVQPRPADFATSSPAASGNCGGGIALPPGVHSASPPPVHYWEQFLFRDGGRILVASVAAAGDPPRELSRVAPNGRYIAPNNSLLAAGLRVLNTLEVSATRGRGSTAPTQRTSGVASAPTTTTPTLPRPAGPPPENQADASRAIQVAYAAAFAANSPQQVSDAVEGGFQLSPADRAQGPGAPTPPGQGETARVTALSFVDQTHAAVNFELLLDNIRISPITPGTAVLVDGTWKVTRTTYCGIIVNLGGAACPA